MSDAGWSAFATGWYIEIEFSVTGGPSRRVRGRVMRIDGPEMVADGHIATSPTKLWSIP